ncbi:Tigger transposable element-derived protein 1 [Cucumispora dikerogammari]|nr:Tigger transposable element-derived protein 1 [Cucumispora dikerogammari]
MSKEKRNVALIMDNATCHSVNATFSNIDIIFLPKNTTSLIQPCDQGIIKSFKDKYVRFMTEYMIYNEISAENIDKIIKNTSIFDAICIAKLAWEDVSIATIVNCFNKALKFGSEQYMKKMSEYTTEIEKDIKPNLMEEILDDVFYDLEDSKDSFSQSGKRLYTTGDEMPDMVNLESSFSSIITFLKRHCPEYILKLYKLKVGIMQTLKKK